jgi:outer membrane protein assembly factor BamD (BamD/ComL family)
MNSNKPRFAVALAALALVAAKPASKPAASDKGSGTADAAKSPDRERLDAAIRDLKEERYPTAAVALYELSQNAQSPLRDEAEYQLAKALYRMKLHHAALNSYTALLSRGPSGKYYRSALEWSLFVARKVAADERVMDAIARYSDGSFPDEYKNEFRYSLARYHFLRGLSIESGGEAAATGETKVEENVTGGKSLKGDVFEGGAEEPDKPDAAAGGGDDDPGVKRKGHSLSIDEDVFGGEEGGKKGGNGGGAKKDSKKKKGHSLHFDEPAPPPKADAPPAAPAPVAKPAEPKAAAIKADLTAKEHFEAAGKLVSQVDSASTFGARAKFLDGVLAFRANKENDALEAFKSVLRLTKSSSERSARELRQLAFFQLARTHFGAKQPSYSIYYYDKVERLTYDWLEAIYEGSWAEFRLGNYEKALGNLLTLHSPFFENEYFPESHILKAVVYYENCRYPEAKTILDDFTKRYEPVLAELKKMTAQDQAPDKWYEVLSNLKAADTNPGGPGGAGQAQTLGQILQIALSDKDLEKLDTSYREVEQEIKSYKEAGGPLFEQSRLRNHLEEVVGAERDSLRKDAGRAVKRKLETEREAIKTLIQQAIRINIETARAEQERIEGTLRKVESGPKEQEKEFVEWADDEKDVWPFSDEYWRDELGTYQLTLARSCR